MIKRLSALLLLLVTAWWAQLKYPGIEAEFTASVELSSPLPAPEEVRPQPEIPAPTVETIQLNYRLPPTAVRLTPSRWIGQSFNNCAPAATAMALQHFGIDISQEVVKLSLRTNATDKNVFMDEIAAYLLSEHQVYSRPLVNGSLERVKILLANDFYVMAEVWLRPGEDIGHNLLITGYDDEQGVIILDDPYFSGSRAVPYSDFEQQWTTFQHNYLPMYRPQQEDLLKATVGEDWEADAMWQRFLSDSQTATGDNPNDMEAWLNLGIASFHLGDYEAARLAFDQSRQLGWPTRLLWYHVVPVRAYNQTGHYQTALDLALSALRNNAEYAEMQAEAAAAYAGLGQLEAARDRLRLALIYDAKLERALQLQQQLSN